MAIFTANDVLLKHNNDVLSYAVDSFGNRKFQVFLDIYRSSFLHAEERKDTITCNRIVNDIVDTICTKSVPAGRFLEFDDKKNEWYDVGTGAIPCQRARTGLLGLLEKTTGNDYHVDKPIVEMSKTKRARTMKALHFSEKKLRAVINLNDDRFKLKEQILIRDTPSCTPLVEMKASSKRSNDKHVTFANSVKNNMKGTTKEGRATKRRKVTSREVENVDIICGGAGEGILHIDTPGNRLYHSLISARQKNYTKSDDKEKFKEVCKVIKSMQQICPTCRFVKHKANSNEVAELSWQDIMEKTIQTISKPCVGEFLSDVEIETFIAMHNSYISDLLNDVPDTVKSVDSNNGLLSIKEVPDDIFSTFAVEDNKDFNKSTVVENYLIDENTHLEYDPEQDDYLDVFFPEIGEHINESIAADEFLDSILVP